MFNRLAPLLIVGLATVVACGGGAPEPESASTAHAARIEPVSLDKDDYAVHLGNLAEIGPAEDVYRDPQHLYSKALLSAVPRPDPTRDCERIRLEGDIPTPIRKPSGCGFRTRCLIAQAACAEDVPELRAVDGRLVACPWV